LEARQDQQPQEEIADEEEDEIKKSKTEQIVNEFSKKIEKFERQYQLVPEMKKCRGRTIGPMKRTPYF